MNKKKISLIILGGIVAICLVVITLLVLSRPTKITKEAVVESDPTRTRYNNPGQGLYQCHADNRIGSDYIKGGALIVSWGKLQPNGPDEFDQEELASLISKIRSQGKRHYLHFALYEYGNAGGTDVFPGWLNVNNSSGTLHDTTPIEEDDLIEMIYIGNNFVGGKLTFDLYPQPWGVMYQQRLGEFLTKLNHEFEEAGVLDYIEYIEPAAGGVWGTTHLWFNRDDGNNNDLNRFVEAAGCSRNDWACLGQKFTQGVNKTFETYMRAFPDLPMMIIGGSCKFAECSYSGISNMVDRYGVRFMYKSAGIGTTQADCGIRTYTLNPLCQGANARTKCGQEPWSDSIQNGGPGFNPDSACGKDYREVYETSLSDEPISYYCLYSSDTIFDNSLVGNTNKLLANGLGAQIMLANIDYGFDPNQTITGNQNLNITFSWRNEGSVPLIAPLKQGEKWTASSYKLFLEFEDERGNLVHYHEFDINPSTTTWLPDSQITNSINFSIHGLGSSLSAGRYNLYVGLTDPNGENKRFVLINADNNDPSRGRYSLTTLNLDVSPQPTSQPSSTPISTATPMASPTQIAISPTAIPTPVLSSTPITTSIPTVTPVLTTAPTTVPTSVPTRVPTRIPTSTPRVTNTPVPQYITATPSPVITAAVAQTEQWVDTTVNCNQVCTSNANCSNISHICHEGSCRLDVNPTNELCHTATGETKVLRMAEKPVAGFGDWLNNFKIGLGAIGIGLMLLLFL